jgi:hypothetical protein
MKKDKKEKKPKATAEKFPVKNFTMLGNLLKKES